MLNLNSSGSGRLNFLFSCSSRCLARVSAALSGGAASGFWRVLLLGDPLWTLAERSSRCSFRPGVRLSVTRRVCVREPARSADRSPSRTSPACSASVFRLEGPQRVLRVVVRVQRSSVRARPFRTVTVRSEGTVTLASSGWR